MPVVGNSIKLCSQLSSFFLKEAEAGADIYLKCGFISLVKLKEQK